jgi:hypothetical protein
MTPMLRVIAILSVAALAASLCTPAFAASALERAYRVIQNKQFVDLTHSFDTTTPVWSGFGQARMTPAADPKTKKPYTIKDDGFRTTIYEMAGQYGTHVDPPAHFDEKGITMDEIPLKQMILPLIVLDDTPYLASDPNHAFSLVDLKSWEKKHGRVPRGPFVALRTDMSKDWDSNPERFKRVHSRRGRSRRSSSSTNSAASPPPATKPWIPIPRTRWSRRRTSCSTAIIRSR